MKEEYATFLIFMFIALFAVTITNLVIDLFEDGVFVSTMIIFLLIWIPFIVIGFLIQAFKTNYKIVRR